MITHQIQSIAVCGAGTMGTGIAQTAALAGFTTRVYDPSAEALQRAAAVMEKQLGTLVEKEKLSQPEKENVLSRISYSSDISACAADLVIEAILENLAIKRDLFAQLATVNTPSAILASNTSSLSVTAIAEGMQHPERICGLHFFNPAPLMKLVEVVNTAWTSASVTETARRVVESMGKTAVVCRDAPGFIVNRVARHYYLEPLRLAAMGKMAPETIDAALENAGFRMGPFRLMDLIGNDVNLAVSQSLYEACGKPERLKPSLLQEEKVRKGELGRKTGKGFYTYDQ